MSSTSSPTLHFTPAPSAVLPQRKASIADGKSKASAARTDARESSINLAVKAWFGPLEMVCPAARKAETASRDACARTLLRLHKISCDRVSESQRIPLPESDIHAAIVILNRLAVMMKINPETIIAYCEARSIRENSLRANQLDPFQLRHLLTFHQEIPHEELNSGDLHHLKSACEHNDSKALLHWFKAVIAKRRSLPTDASQYLRHLMLELWHQGHRAFLDTFATELAVFDICLLDAIGWENTRLFYALLKRLEGSACSSCEAYLSDEDIDTGLEMYRILGDADQVLHFRALATKFETQTLRRLERTLFAAANERIAQLPSSLPVSTAMSGNRIASTSTGLLAQKSLRPIC